MTSLLLVEDEAVIREALGDFLARAGYRVRGAATLAEARQRLADGPVDLVLADLRLPDGEGTELLAELAGVPLIVLTSYASVRSAVQAMQQGAADYIAKPFDHHELALLIERTLRSERLQRRARQLHRESGERFPVHALVGQSAAMRRVFAQMEKIAPTDASVLIRGESGTGKELVARALHAHSLRAEAPFITVNCASIPENLIESELFGHEKGAFTGAVTRREGLIAAAHNGTLFLDEIGELAPGVQAQLLRVLQNGELRPVGSSRVRHVNVRLLAATHRDLAAMVRDGRFREDLYYRLNVLVLHLPPLRERREDIAPLAEFLLGRLCTRLNRPPLRLGAAALARLQAHHWPGNVRELENCLERAVILGEGTEVDPELLGLEAGPPPAPAADPLEQALSLEEYFRQFVLRYQDRLTETELARRLGISRKSLWERRQRLGLLRPGRDDGRD